MCVHSSEFTDVYASTSSASIAEIAMKSHGARYGVLTSFSQAGSGQLQSRPKDGWSCRRERGGSQTGGKPNWLLLAYLVLSTAVVAIAVLLVSGSAVAQIAAWSSGVAPREPENWVTILSMISLGILPWPGLLLLARSALHPMRAQPFSVQDEAISEVTVTLVALDEEAAIGRVVEDFKNHPRVAEVIVVDNGSNDRTREIAERSGAGVVVEDRRGYGNACKRALAEGLIRGAAAVVLCEADCSYQAQDIDKLIAYLRHADLVIGSRTHPALLNTDSQLDSFLTLGNLFVAKLLQMRYWDWNMGGKTRFTDVGCTYMALRAEGLQCILARLQVGGNHFLPHILMTALENGLRVLQVPVTFWRRVGKSKGGNGNWLGAFRLGLRMICHILTYRVPGDRESFSPRVEIQEGAVNPKGLHS